MGLGSPDSGGESLRGAKRLTGSQHHDQLLLAAENSNTYTPLGPGDERIENERYVVWLGAGTHPGFNVVQRLRLRESEVEATVAEVRALLADRGRRASTWEVGSSASPADLGERLLALGMAPDREHVAAAMVLTAPPPAGWTGAVASRVRTLEEYRAAQEIAYRALVAARWDEAVRRGTPALITQAGTMSKPILTRLGFEQVAEIRVYLDQPEGPAPLDKSFREGEASVRDG